MDRVLRSSNAKKNLDTGMEEVDPFSEVSTINRVSEYRSEEAMSGLSNEHSRSSSPISKEIENLRTTLNEQARESLDLTSENAEVLVTKKEFTVLENTVKEEFTTLKNTVNELVRALTQRSNTQIREEARPIIQENRVNRNISVVIPETQSNSEIFKILKYINNAVVEFGKTEESPLDFLEKYERAVEGFNIPEQVKVRSFINKISVYNGSWDRTVQRGFASYAQVKIAFLESFWDRNTQVRIYNQLKEEKIDFSDNAKTINQISKLIKKLGQLDQMNLCNEQILQVVLQKFPYELRWALLSDVRAPEDILQKLKQGAASGLKIHTTKFADRTNNTSKINIIKTEDAKKNSIESEEVNIEHFLKDFQLIGDIIAFSITHTHLKKKPFCGSYKRFKRFASSFPKIPASHLAE